jgi:ribosomal protein S27E
MWMAYIHSVCIKAEGNDSHISRKETQMRVAIKRAGKTQVDEIIEFEVQDNGDVILWTHDEMMDIIVHGMSESDIEKATHELLYDGHANLTMFESELTMFESEYDESDEECADDMTPQDELLDITCSNCRQEFRTPSSAVMDDFVRCPYCGARTKL